MFIDTTNLEFISNRYNSLNDVDITAKQVDTPKRKHLYNASDFNNVSPVENIIAVYNAVVAQLSSVELVNASNWYPIAHKWCADVAQAYGLTVSQVAGITAAMSPQISWDKNKLQTILLIQKMRNSEELTGLMAYRANVAKAVRIYNGENALDVLGGKKVRSFYGNLMLDDSTVTIDRHALHIALYGTGNEEKSGSITPTDKLYDIAQSAYVAAANILGITPYSLQSITWTFKAQNNGKVS